MASARPYSSRFRYGSEAYRRERQKELETELRRAEARKKRGPKAARKVAAKKVSAARYSLKRLAGLKFSMLTFVRGSLGNIKVTPPTRADASKIGRYMNRVKQADDEENYYLVERELGKSDRYANTTEGKIYFETDPDRLREIVDNPDNKITDIIIGKSP